MPIQVEKIGNFKKNQPAFNNFFNEPAGETGRFIHKRITKKILIRSKSMVGVKTGALRKSINPTHIKISDGQFVIIGSGLNYAYMHHEGTRPHIIVPNQAHMLRFTSHGRIVHARIVRHPGTRPNHYLSLPMLEALWDLR